MSELNIRDATPADHDAVRDLTLAAYAEYADIMEPTAWTGLEGAVRAALETEEAARIVAELDGRLVGSVMLFPPASDAYGGLAGRAPAPELRLLAVAADARGHGIGRALVDACVARATEMGATELGLHTSRSMRVATALYLGMGFERAPEHDFRPPGAELVKAYRLRLRESEGGGEGARGS